jgi:hypothetical protein
MTYPRLRFLLFLWVFLTSAPCAQAESFRLPQPNTPVSMSEIQAICRHYGLTELWSLIESNPPNTAFRSDGCSAWPDTWLKGEDLYEGCFIHDLFYWSGVPGDDMGRLKADVWLMMWVAEHVSIELGEAMFNGVRVGGSARIDTPWRWGFGRTENR